MRPNTRWRNAISTSSSTARTYSGLVILFGGLLLACLLFSFSFFTDAKALAHPTTALFNGELTQGIQAVDPPTGTLDGFPVNGMEAVEEWQTGKGSSAISITVAPVPGYSGQAVQMVYILSETSGITENWVQIAVDLPDPDILSNGDHIRIRHRGTATNTLQIGMISTTNDIYFSRDVPRVTHVPNWTYFTWDLHSLRNDAKGPLMQSTKVKRFFISVKESDEKDVAGPGSYAVDQLEFVDIGGRTVPSLSERITADSSVIQRAAQWIAARQQASGLVKSWLEEKADLAWLYDQALALIVFSETDLDRAQRLAERLHELQNSDGSWDSGYHYSEPITSVLPMTQPVGANAWTVYALAYYATKSGSDGALQDAKEGVAWLASLQRVNGSLPAVPGEAAAPTEPNLDAWWAFKATGYQTETAQLENFLLTELWDEDIGRFKASPDSYEIFLDNQTWGAAFLRAIGREDDARSALSYARWTLAVTSFDGNTNGFDGAGPFSVWNEGTLQYIAAQGENSRYYWDEMVAQQNADGGLPGSPNEFSGHSVWLTRMHGIAPTAWLYWAGAGGPFQPRATFTSSITGGVAPLTVAFTNTSSGMITETLWNFGDGLTSTEMNPIHTYAPASAYTVTLIVSGPGGSDTISRTVFIEEIYLPTIMRK